VSTGLSLLFLVVYGGCLWITSQRQDVATFYFAWERSVPFVPFMILPYLSIDLFFVAAPFLLPDESDLWLFVRRTTVVILVAGAFFLVLPLRFAFPRPAVAGWLGTLFDSFRAWDRPYNLFPSLHAALLVLLAVVYGRHLGKGWRPIVLIWFVLIGFSPLLTHQHHVVDIAGGFALATACLFVIRKRNPSPECPTKSHDGASLP
jgi:membrane-associated phospholipid phosphatase